METSVQTKSRAIRRAVVLLLGVVVPLLWWLDMYLGLPPAMNVHGWGRAAHLPELVLWSIPWLPVCLSVVLARSRIWRLFLGPGMLLVSMVGNGILGYQVIAMWGGQPTMAEVLIFIHCALYLDAIPAVLVMVIGLLLARRQAALKNTGGAEEGKQKLGPVC